MTGAEPSTTPTAPAMPDLTGRTAVVTGPSLDGIGFFTALGLARAGARVVLAGRSTTKLDDAAQALSAAAHGPTPHTVRLDLTSFASIRAAASELADLGPLDLLINNAGVMATPPARTTDGLELQIGTNHFGPFLLTGLLFDQIQAAAGRVVTVSSLAHRVARRAPVADPRAEFSHYRRWPTYAGTKLANLLFTAHLDRRLGAAGSPVAALAAHPGLASTRLVTNGRSFGPLSSVLNGAYGLIAQSAEAAAGPTLMAATAALPSGTFVGPAGPAQTRGRPTVVAPAALAQDPVAAATLWKLSEQVTGFTWP